MITQPKGYTVKEVQLATPLNGGAETLTIHFETGEKLIMIGRTEFCNAEFVPKVKAKEAHFTDLIPEEKRLTA